MYRYCIFLRFLYKIMEHVQTGWFCYSFYETILIGFFNHKSYMAIKLSFVSGDDIRFNFHKRIDVKHCHCCHLICRWHYRHNLGDRYCISTNSMPSSLSAYYYVLNACISIIVDCCLRPNRPDYSWNTACWTLSSNQSINQY
jgi:hypothetical protein